MMSRKIAVGQMWLVRFAVPSNWARVYRVVAIFTDSDGNQVVVAQFHRHTATVFINGQAEISPTWGHPGGVCFLERPTKSPRPEGKLVRTAVVRSKYNMPGKATVRLPSGKKLVVRAGRGTDPGVYVDGPITREVLRRIRTAARLLSPAEEEGLLAVSNTSGLLLGGSFTDQSVKSY